MEYGNHRKHSAGARNVKARAKRALLLPSRMITEATIQLIENSERFR